MLAQNLGTDGIGFAIPVNMVRGVMDQIIEHGRVRRGWLGVSSEEVPRATAAALGHRSAGALRISNVDPHGPGGAASACGADDLVDASERSADRQCAGGAEPRRGDGAGLDC